MNEGVDAAASRVAHPFGQRSNCALLREISEECCGTSPGGEELLGASIHLPLTTSDEKHASATLGERRRDGLAYLPRTAHARHSHASYDEIQFPSHTLPL